MKKKAEWHRGLVTAGILENDNHIMSDLGCLAPKTRVRATLSPERHRLTPHGLQFASIHLLLSSTGAGVVLRASRSGK
jgi:hypothetical protein